MFKVHIDRALGFCVSTHRLLSSSFWGLPYRILNMNHKKEQLRSLWVGAQSLQFSGGVWGDSRGFNPDNACEARYCIV